MAEFISLVLIVAVLLADLVLVLVCNSMLKNRDRVIEEQASEITSLKHQINNLELDVDRIRGERSTWSSKFCDLVSHFDRGVKEIGGRQ